MGIAAPFSGERKVFGRSKSNHWRFLEDPEKVYPWQKDDDDTLLECFENKTILGYDNEVVLKQLLNIPSVRAKDSIDAQNLMGETALFLTAKVGVPESLYLLLEAGADPLIANKKGKTPLEAVAQGVKCAMINDYSSRGKAMLNRLLKIPSVRQNITEREAYWLSLTKTLKTFIKLEDIESIRNLLKYFNAEEINSKWHKLKPKEGESFELARLFPSDDPPSFIATTDFLEIIETGHLETVNLLLEAGADPLIPNGDGNNALMIAVLSGYTTVVQRLLEIQVVRDNINATNKQGDSVLSIAAELGHQEIMNLLQAAEANSEIPRREGKKTEKKKSLHTKKAGAGTNTTGKSQKQSPFLRETAEAEKKKTSLPEDSFWERALSGLKKLL